jgi:iron transport multicopper oxidase
LPDAAIILEDSFQEFDDYTLVPYDKEPLFPDPDQSITLEVVMSNLGDGAN